MARFAEFEALVRLLDDESETVRSAVSKRLLEYEDILPDYLGRLEPPPSPERCALMNRLLREARCETLSDHWEDCLAEPDATTRLELALGVLSDYLDGERLRSGRLTKSLDELAHDLRGEGVEKSPFMLSRALFQSGRLTGNRDDYYAPSNSSLVQVIARGRGNPISLTCILMLVGHRLGIEIKGCNYPGHFLALLPSGEGEMLIVDCFNGGQVLTFDELLKPDLNQFEELRDALREGAPAEIILLRVLRNLHRSFQQTNQAVEQRTIEHIIERMISRGLV